MTLLGLRTAVVDSIEANVTAFETVEAHGGRFDSAELKRIALQSPAARIAVLGGGLSRQGGTQAVGLPTVVCFIVTRGTSQIKRDAAALTLVEAVCGLVAENKWAYSDAKAPESMRFDNLYSGTIDRLGVALWSVSWVQQADLAIADTSSVALDEFHKAWVDWDLAPVDGTIDAQQLIQVWGELMAAYEHIYISTPAATAISVAGTYQKAAGTTTAKLELDCDMPVTNRARHTGTVAKPFLVRVSGALSVSSDAEVKVAIAKGGTVDENTKQVLDVTSAEGAKPFSIDGIFSLDTNEYVEIWVTADSTINVTLETANLVMGAT